ncbi:MAG TPA: biopolymer transporter ExbD [Rhizomicrobium sp.]|nr:biopolymer transporter ExbD [Rhizomicrobium sp.]
MAFGEFDRKRNAPMSEINIIPLVDVMLVLLVIFIITAPVMTHAVKVELPKLSSVPEEQKPDSISVSITNDGRLFSDDKPVTMNQLVAQMKSLAARDDRASVHLRADKQSRYERIAEIMVSARDAGVSNIGFVMLPTK